jgi:hypothetical protein
MSFPLSRESRLRRYGNLMDSRFRGNDIYRYVEINVTKISSYGAALAF